MLNKLVAFVCVFLLAYSSVGMDSSPDAFKAFKDSIIGKEGPVVCASVAEKLRGGLDKQIEALSAHMRDEGHFGVRGSKIDGHAARQMAKRWGTFFVKPDGSLYTPPEQDILLHTIWDSGQLAYAGDVPSAPNIFYLDGKVGGIHGIAFSNNAATRSSFAKGGGLDNLNAENLMAIRLAVLGRAPARRDFVSDDEFEMAKMVYEAGPHFGEVTTVRIKLDLADGMCEFNTCFPRD
jgi:hypothetical protein